MRQPMFHRLTRGEILEYVLGMVDNGFIKVKTLVTLCTATY